MTMTMTRTFNCRIFFQNTLNSTGQNQKLNPRLCHCHDDNDKENDKKTTKSKTQTKIKLNRHISVQNAPTSTEPIQKLSTRQTQRK